MFNVGQHTDQSLTWKSPGWQSRAALRWLTSSSSSEKNFLQSRSLQNHGVRIMNLVKFAVDNIDDPDKYLLSL